jgi:hypothetical protein
VFVPFDIGEETAMQVLATTPMVFAAIEYSMLYMLCGGGLVGAAVIYGVAKAFNK